MKRENENNRLKKRAFRVSVSRRLQIGSSSFCLVDTPTTSRCGRSFLPGSVRDAKFHLVSSHQIKLDPDANEAGTPQNAMMTSGKLEDESDAERRFPTTSPEQPANQSQLKQLSLPSSVQLGRGSRTLQLQCYAEVLAVLEVGGSAASL